MKLNIGDKIKLDIRKQGINGEGIGYYQKVAVFVPGAILKETVNIEIVNSFDKYAIGKIVDIERVSNRRVVPPCKFYDDCGGCQMQHIEYYEQLKIKQSIIKQALRRYTNLNTEKLVITKTIGMKNPYNYRNKSQMPFKNTNFGLVLGFYKPNSNHFVYVDECMIHHEEINNINNHVLKLMRKYQQKAYDLRNKEGILHYLVVRYLEETKSASVIIVVKKKSPVLKLIAEELLSDLKVVKSVSYSIDNEKSNLVISNPIEVIAGTNHIIEIIEDYKFKISPDAFHQMNTIQMKAMYNLIINLANVDKNTLVFDLYSGIGITSIMLAKLSKKVYGIDYSESSVKDAIENARINNIDNIEFIQSHVESALPKLLERKIKPDVLLLDPPRSGMSETVVNAVLEVLPKQIIYVSCNPSTLAKNISDLSVKYQVKSINPIDMFPQTASVESVSLLVLK
ncbi:MAG: 23S rRNA (uracil(1939)-C(5))-methyltransferase RlmD [Candidatus Izemoplasmatales bacterium]